MTAWQRDGLACRYAHSMLRMAEISPDGQYRYRLGRRWGNGCFTRIAWIMLNPSTADGAIDDPTIRRCIGFSMSWGFGAMEVVNLYALRATEPRVVRDSAAAIGPDNDASIARAAAGADTIIAAWGAFAWAQDRADAVLAMLEPIAGPISCLGVTRGGMPRHPLYVRRDAALVTLAGATRRTTGACRAPAKRR
jgi:hypothetical protein